MQPAIGDRHLEAAGVGTVERERVAEGRRGFNVYDVAGIANKGISQRIISAPFSELGQDIHVETSNASCMALPTTQPVSLARNRDIVENMPENLESPMHPLYAYAFVVDAEEGLIPVNIESLVDGDPRNNDLDRATTWNPNGILDGARHITMGGYYAYITTADGVVIVSVDNPLAPQLVATIPMRDARATALQFRYLFVTSGEGLSVIDVTDPAAPRAVADNTIRLADARKVFLARTYAYVAAGADGLVIVDIENPEAMREYQRFDAEGTLNDSNDVVVASTNATLFAYVADGSGGIKVLQLTPKTRVREKRMTHWDCLFGFGRLKRQPPRGLVCKLFEGGLPHPLTQSATNRHPQHRRACRGSVRSRCEK